MQISSELTRKITTLKKPSIIAVSGFGGSGKTTFANLLGKSINTPTMNIDSFMVVVKDRNLQQYSAENLIDFHRFKQEAIFPFQEGKNPIFYGHYDWITNTIAKTVKLSHNGLVIIEGIWLFRPNLMKYFDYSIWIDSPIDEAVRRGKKRDREVHKNPQDEQWDTFWKPNDLEFFNQFHPEKHADLIIDNR